MIELIVGGGILLFGGVAFVAIRAGTKESAPSQNSTQTQSTSTAVTADSTEFLQSLLDRAIQQMADLRLKLVLSGADPTVTQAYDRAFKDICHDILTISVAPDNASTIQALLEIVRVRVLNATNFYVIADEPGRATEVEHVCSELKSASTSFTEMARLALDVSGESHGHSDGAKSSMQCFEIFTSLPALVPVEEDAGGGALESLGIGAYIFIKEKLYRVTEKNRYVEKYESKTWKWWELRIKDILSGIVYSLEYERDDELEVYFEEDKPSMGDIGLTIEQVHQFIKDEEGQLRHDRKLFELTDSGEATLYKGEETKGEKFVYCDFQDASGRLSLSIALWQRDPEVYVMRRRNLPDIKMYQSEAG